MVELVDLVLLTLEEEVVEELQVLGLLGQPQQEVLVVLPLVE
jgi:hypothetical protein